jgi:hypothetical protein
LPPRLRLLDHFNSRSQIMFPPMYTRAPFRFPDHHARLSGVYSVGIGMGQNKLRWQHTSTVRLVVKEAGCSL